MQVLLLHGDSVGPRVCDDQNLFKVYLIHLKAHCKQGALRGGFMKSALITGGTRGIGAAIAKLFHAKGYRVLATYANNTEKANSFSRETGITTLKWDITNTQIYASAQKTVLDTVGPIDILINNAGITRDALLSKMTPDMWHSVIATNLTPLFYLCQWVVPFMSEKQWGRIVNLSSINAFKGQRGQTNYTAAKAGVLGFTKSLAQEVIQSGITVNAIAPGYTETDMVAAVPDTVLEKIKKQIPAGRLGTAQEIAYAALSLAQNEASYITGTTLHINGGHLMA